jgi:hypothetical protein
MNNNKLNNTNLRNPCAGDGTMGIAHFKFYVISKGE